MGLEDGRRNHLYKKCTLKVSPSDIFRIACLLSVQAPGEEVLPIIVFFPLIASNLLADTKGVVSHWGRE